MVIMVSAVFDWRTLVFAHDDISDNMNLPTYVRGLVPQQDTPTSLPAWKLCPAGQGSLAKGEYTTALMEGDGLTGRRVKDKERLSYFTGLARIT